MKRIRQQARCVVAAFVLIALLVGCRQVEPSQVTEPTALPVLTKTPVPPTKAPIPPTAASVLLADTPIPPMPENTDTVEGWAVLAQKDDYSDVDMTDLPVDYAGITQMRQVLEDSGWDPGHIHELREFDRETLVNDLDWLEQNADEDDVVFLYVAAHGSYLRDVMLWSEFFADEWAQIVSHRRLLVIDSCQAANYIGAVTGDLSPHLSVAAVAGDEYGWSGLEEEGLPIIGGVFTHYFAAAFDDSDTDTDGDGIVSVQEAALVAEGQQRTYMHDVVFAVPEFVEMYHDIGVFPDQDPEFPRVIVDDVIGEPLFLMLDAYSSASEIGTNSPSLSDIVLGLEGMPIDDFFEESYKRLLLRSPERITRLGITESLDMRNDQLDNLSDAYTRETQELEAAILTILQTYDQSALSSEQQISYDVYEWYLDDLVRGHEFMYYDYPVHHFLGGYHDVLIRILTEIHPITNKRDAEDYVSRLSLVDEQVDQLLEGLVLREEIGVIPPSFIIEMTIDQMKNYLGTRSSDPTAVRAESLTVYTVFDEKLEMLDGLSKEEKQTLRDAALAEIQDSFAPAYVDLLDYMDRLLLVATDDAGVWKFSDGDAYYAYILRNQTSTEMTPAEIHELGLTEVTRIQAEMRQVFDELGYSQDESLRALLDRAASVGGHHDIRTQEGKDQLIDAYEAILDGVDERLDAAFDIRPQADVVIIGGPFGGYYVPGSSGGSRPGAFHIRTNGSWASKFIMPSLSYHEAVPGHHFQIAIAQELDLPTFRTDIAFNGYVEGWALYAERLAWELGVYDDDPYGNVGRLYYELLRAVRLVVDTGIHAKRWTRAEARAYMMDVLGSAGEVDRYIVRPAQATGYKIGMLKILELRQQAMDQLGDRFDLKEFHRVVLGNGSMPLDILERAVQDYIDAKR
ncbi:MAG: DUF885 family protein [Chloroflexi bacterium]|nr:DUF885 family protein [Chloroflexota bacterium]